MTKEIQLPDFDDIMNLIEKIRDISLRASELKNSIAFEEARIVKEVSINPKYWQSGKPPSMTFVESTFKLTGLENELVSRRIELTKLQSELDDLRLKLQFYRDMISLYQSESANKRAGLV